MPYEPLLWPFSPGDVVRDVVALEAAPVGTVVLEGGDLLARSAMDWLYLDGGSASISSTALASLEVSVVSVPRPAGPEGLIEWVASALLARAAADEARFDSVPEEQWDDLLSEDHVINGDVQRIGGPPAVLARIVLDALRAVAGIGPGGKPTFKATARREGLWWVLEVEGLGATQVRSLRRAKPALRGLLAAILNVEEDRFDVKIIKV